MTLTSGAGAGFGCDGRSGNRERLRFGRHREPGFGRRCDGALALEVHDDAIGVVERVDAVARVAFEVEHDARALVRLPPDPHLLHDVVREGDGRVLERLDGSGVLEIEEHARRTVDPLVVERHFLPELDHDAQDLGQHFARDAGEGSRQRRETGRRGRRRGDAAAAARAVRGAVTSWLRRPGAAWSARRPSRSARSREARRQRREQPQRRGAIGGIAELPERIGGQSTRPARARCRRSRSPGRAATCPRRRRPARARVSSTDACASSVRARWMSWRSEALARERVVVQLLRLRRLRVHRRVRARPARATDGSSEAAHRLPRSSRDRPAPRAACRRRPATPGLRPPSCPPAARRG